MNSQQFQIGFWHPFGPHGGETAEEILERKNCEILANGWTLWSFQLRRTLDVWKHEIRRAEPSRVLVFCSDGSGSDPQGEVVPCRSHRLIGSDNWQALPAAIQIPHPMGRKTEASAFVVKRIIHPAEAIDLPPVEWFSANGDPWRTDRLPTRGEYLIRPGGFSPIRRYRAVLELKDPYLAVVSSKPVPPTQQNMPVSNRA